MPAMTPETRKRIITAYDAAMKAAGGIAKASVRARIDAAALSADVTSDAAHKVLAEHLAGLGW